VLDTGPKGSIRNLQIVGETVEWQHEGARKSAALS
jgi:hypothetical protein